MDLHPDFRDLLAELVRASVRFALIGGYAVGHHAKPRATKDLDVVVYLGREPVRIDIPCRPHREQEGFGAASRFGGRGLSRTCPLTLAEGSGTGACGKR